MFKLADDVLLQRAGEEALLVKLNAEDVFSLNATGLHIVEIVTGGQPLARVVDTIAAAYEGSPAQIAADVDRLVATLVERGLLVAIA
jgi:hypothetical protein